MTCIIIITYIITSPATAYTRLTVRICVCVCVVTVDNDEHVCVCVQCETVVRLLASVYFTYVYIGKPWRRFRATTGSGEGVKSSHRYISDRVGGGGWKRKTAAGRRRLGFRVSERAYRRPEIDFDHAGTLKIIIVLIHVRGIPIWNVICVMIFTPSDYGATPRVPNGLNFTFLIHAIIAVLVRDRIVNTVLLTFQLLTKRPRRSRLISRSRYVSVLRRRSVEYFRVLPRKTFEITIYGCVLMSNKRVNIWALVCSVRWIFLKLIYRHYSRQRYYVKILKICVKLKPQDAILQVHL